MSGHRILQDIEQAAQTDVFRGTDPGDAGAISFGRWGTHIPLVSAGAETRTLANPTGLGQMLTLEMQTDGGDIVVTVASAYNQAGSTTITFDDAGDFITLIAVQVGTNLRWRPLAGDGVTGAADGTHLPLAGGTMTGDIVLGDAIDVALGADSDALVRWSTGDASDHSVVVALGDTSQMLHITDKAAVATDWNITSPTHPTLYVHSNTTPITDYLLIGGHDGTTANIDVVGGTTLALKIAGTTELDLTGTVLNLADGNIFFVGVEATPGTTAGSNWIGIEDSGTDPAGTLTNSLAIYTPDGGDSLDFLHADGTTDSLGT